MKLFIGYDHGDAETLLSYINPNMLRDNATFHSKTMPEDMVMPTRKDAGLPVASVFAVAKNGKTYLGRNVLGADPGALSSVYFSFKKQPTSFFKNNSQTDLALLEKAFEGEEREWPKVPLAQDPGLIAMRDAFVKYINCIFLDEGVKGKLGQFPQCDEIVVAIGHPTKWSRLDVSIYMRIFRQSVLGETGFETEGRTYRLSLIMAPESRAAFLYARQSYIGEIDDNMYSLLIDVGSSTIDITALTGRSVNGEYNDGHTNLGAQLIDRQIYAYFVHKLESAGKLESYNNLCRYNPYLENTMLFASRLAKEDFFSGNAEIIKIESPDDALFPTVRLTRDEMENVINSPIQALHGYSWAMSFDQFMLDQKRTLQEKNIAVERVILTGSAAQMPFIKQVCKKHFPKIDITLDLNPAKAIAKGLSLVGQSNEKSLEFQKAMEDFLDTRVKKIVEEKMPVLSDKISKIIAAIILYDITYGELMIWKKDTEHYRTLRDAMNAVQKKCKPEDLQKKLANNKVYNRTIEDWFANEVMGTVEAEVLEICSQFNVSRLPISKNEVTLDISDVEMSNVASEGLRGKLLFPVDLLNGIASTVGGLLTAVISLFVVPFIAGVLAGLLSLIATSLALEIAALLLAIPGPGWVALAAVLGIGVAVLISKGVSGLKEQIKEKMLDYHLPMIARNVVTENTLKKSLAKGEQETIKTVVKAMEGKNVVDKLSGETTQGIRTILNQTINNIKYEIEMDVSR